MGSRVLLKGDAVLLCLDGELATDSILDVADGRVEVVDGKPAHCGERSLGRKELTGERRQTRSYNHLTASCCTRISDPSEIASCDPRMIGVFPFTALSGSHAQGD